MEIFTVIPRDWSSTSRVLSFSYAFHKNINDFLDVICNTAIYTDTTLYTKCDQASDLWYLELASELEFIYEILWTGSESGLILMLEKLNLFCLTGLITLALFM